MTSALRSIFFPARTDAAARAPARRSRRPARCLHGRASKGLETLEPRRLLSANTGQPGLQFCSCLSCLPAGLGRAESDLAEADADFVRPAEATTSPSSDSRINALLSGLKWGTSTISYSFFAGGTYYGSEVSPAPVSEAVKASVRYILNDIIAPVINVTFNEVTDTPTSYGLIRILTANISPGYAYAYSPYATDVNRGNSQDRAGDVVLSQSFDVTGSDTNSFRNGPGSHGFMALVHELGHAIGLKHPGNYNGSGTGDGPFLPFGEDNTDNSVMTYNFYSGKSAATMMPYDVLTLQYMYGARTSTRAGDTTYAFTDVDRFSPGSGSTNTPTPIFGNTKHTLWDGGGRDTIDVSAVPALASGYRIDVRPGGWITRTAGYNSQGYDVAAGAATDFSSGSTYQATDYGTRIALSGTVIENVVVSRSSDTIFLNDAANTVSGYTPGVSGGSDVIHASNQSDTLDLSGFRESTVGTSQSGSDLVLNLGTTGTVTVKGYYAVAAGSRMVIRFQADPTITITSSRTALRSGETALITFTLGENSTTFALDDVTVTGGTLAGFSGSGASYTATFTPAPDSTAPGTVAVAAGRFTTGNGAPNVAGELATPISIDTALPTVSISSSRAGLGGGQTALITFTLSEPALGFTAIDVVAGGGTLSGFAGSGTVFTATFTPAANSVAPGTITVAAGTFTDLVGNPNTAAALAPPLTIDSVAPGLTITSSTAVLEGSQTATITFTLGEPVTGFTQGDVTVGGGTLSGFTGSGTVYSATFTPAANSTAPGTVAVAAGAFTDLAGNPNTAGALSPAIVIDTVVPTVTITSSRSALRAGQTATITFALSKPTTGFGLDDVVAGGGTLSGFTGSGAVYTAVFTPAPSSTAPGTVGVPAGAFTDVDGIANKAGALAPSITIDTVPPTITVAAGTAALRAGQTTTITFTLSEPATDFVLADVTAAGGSLSAFAGSGTTYTATFTPTPESTAPGTIAVAAGAFSDAAGNPNTAGGLVTPLEIQTVVPTVAITADTAALRAGQTATITFALSEPVTGFTLADVTATGGSLSGFAGSGTAYTATFTPAPGSTQPGTISVAANAFSNAGGNGNAAAALAPPIAIDTIVPTVTVAASTTALRAGETATITFTLSEPATDFTPADVQVAGGTLSGFAGSGTGYTATFTPAPGSTAAGGITVAAGAFTDAAGNPSTAGGLAAPLVIDTVLPTVEIVSSTASLRAGETAAITFTLSEPANDFTLADVQAEGGSLSGFTGSGITYTATFTPAAASTAPGTILVAAGRFTDAAGNPNVAAGLAAPVAIDTIAPTITVSAGAARLRAGRTTSISLTLSEAAVGFTPDDVAVTGGSLSAVSWSATSLTAIFTPTPDSTAAGTVSVAAGAFTDAAGNPNVGAALATPIEIDTSFPAVTIESSRAGLRAGQTAQVTFRLSEPVTAFSPQAVTTTGGVLSGFVGSGMTYTATFTPLPQSTVPGTVGVAAGALSDAAGNPNTAGAFATPLAIDTVPPTATIASSATSLRAGQSATVTFLLSKPATDFVAADVVAEGGRLSDFTGSGTTYTARFTPAEGSTAFGAIAIPAGRFTDAAGNPNGARTLAPPLMIDTTVPAVSITADVAALRSGQTATITIGLSEPVAGFGRQAVTVSGGELSGFSGSGTAYTATFTPAPGSTTPGVITVAAGAVTDAAGNPNTAGALATPLTIDTLAPTVVRLTTSTPDGRYDRDTTIRLDAVVSEPVRAGSALAATLNTGATVMLASAGPGTTLTGVYLVRLGDDVPRLDILALAPVEGAPVLDLAGNPLTSPALPPPAARLAAAHALRIAAGIRASAPGFASTPEEAIPNRTPVRAIPIVFNAPVTGLTVSALQLRVNGRSVSLRGASLTGSGTEFMLRLPPNRTTLAGVYSIEVSPAGVRSGDVAMTDPSTLFWEQASQRRPRVARAFAR